MITLMSVIVAFLFAISLWYLSSNHKVTFVKLKATFLKFLPNRSWHRLTPAGGTFVSAKGGTFQSDTPGTFVSAMRGTFDSDIPGTFESDTGGTFNPLLSPMGTFSKDELKKYLMALRGEYVSKVKELQKKINKYASTQTTSKKAIARKFDMEGLAAELFSGNPLDVTIEKCKKFFDGDKSAQGKEINKMLDDFRSSPAIVEKIGETLQCINQFGIYRI